MKWYMFNNKIVSLENVRAIEYDDDKTITIRYTDDKTELLSLCGSDAHYAKDRELENRNRILAVEAEFYEIYEILNKEI